jgi:Family of unknown function (DUF6515)
MEIHSTTCRQRLCWCRTTAGTIVEDIPGSGEEMTAGDQKYIKFGETYYQPIQEKGKSVYEVVTVEADI